MGVFEFIYTAMCGIFATVYLGSFLVVIIHAIIRYSRIGFKDQ